MDVVPPGLGRLTIRNRGRLPHWEAEHGIYFVTFRLKDSLPRHVVKAWAIEREEIEKTGKERARSMTGAERRRLRELFCSRIDRYLDAGKGARWLENHDVAQVVATALHHFEGRRYRLYAWCVMPNHVHLVLQPLGNHELPDLMHSLKSYTAKEANRILRRRGQFWQREYYDHLVRDQDDFLRTVEYTAQNPFTANLSDWPWVWVRGRDVR